MNQGIYTLTSDIYHADPAESPSLSCGITKIILKQSPRHAWLNHPKLNPNYVDDSAAKFDLGTAAHSAFLEGIDIVEVLDFPDWRTKAAKEAREAAREAGRIPMLVNQAEAVQGMQRAAREAFASCPYLSGRKFESGEPEQSVIWREGHEKTWCRVRPDWLSIDRDLIIDYKTTDIQNPDAWMRAIPANGYDVQADLYKRGVKAVTGKDPDFVFLVQETSAPYMCYFVGMTPEYLEIGRHKVNKALRIWTQCLASGNWPGYPNRIMYPDPQVWVTAEAEEIAAENSNPGALNYFDVNALGAKENFLTGSNAKPLN